jgi:hypothetical protein
MWLKHRANLGIQSVWVRLDLGSCKLPHFCEYEDLALVLIPGADVMITIFCDFGQFSAKKWHFSQNQCYDQNFE